MNRLLRGAIVLGCVLLGSVLAIATTAVHATWWGLPLGLSATAATLVALPPRGWFRAPYAVAWMLTVGGLSFPRPEGDYVISSDARGYVLLGSAVLLPLWAILSTARPAGPPSGADASGGPDTS